MIIEFQPKNHTNRPESREQSFLAQYVESMVIYEDSDILIVNKPAGVPVYGVSKTCPFGITEAVAASKRKDTHPVHRIDRDTSGLLLLGKSSGIRSALSKQFARGDVKKTYIALVNGEWDPKLSGIVAPLTSREPVRVELSEQAKKAATAFTLIATLRDQKNNPYSLLEAKPFTGRTHQIRSHLSCLGYPIVGDQVYNPDPTGSSRHLLHAFRLTFTHPRYRHPLSVHTPLEPDFAKTVLGLKINTATETYRKITNEARAINHSILLSDPVV